MMAAAAGSEAALRLVELGAVVVALALLARLANRIGLSPIPFYLLAGLAFGEGGLLPLELSEDFVEVGAELGVVLLLFMLGLEYTSEELRTSLRAGWPVGIVNFALNFIPGLIAGLLLGWQPLVAVLLGGVTYVSSSGVIAKVLADLDRLGNRETPAVLTVLVMEDLTMAVYLPVVAALLVGGSLLAGLASLSVALVAVVGVLLLALRFGEPVSRAIHSPSDEVVLLTIFGLVLLVGGIAQRLQVSSAIGAFLVGIALSEPVAERARTLLGPLRDLFAAVFFIFFGLQVDPATIPPVAGVAVGLGVVTAVTKIAAGWWAAFRLGVRSHGRWRAGATLIPRGEFSIVIAGLGTGVNASLGALAAAYVLFMAVLGPLAARVVDPVVAAVQALAGSGAPVNPQAGTAEKRERTAQETAPER
jgi:CPA2 family monovalent cation:H+ antiporter-2